jgi:hypothetical protein
MAESALHSRLLRDRTNRHRYLSSGTENFMGYGFPRRLGAPIRGRTKLSFEYLGIIVPETGVFKLYIGLSDLKMAVMGSLGFRSSNSAFIPLTSFPSARIPSSSFVLSTNSCLPTPVKSDRAFNGASSDTLAPLVSNHFALPTRVLDLSVPTGSSFRWVLPNTGTNHVQVDRNKALN